MKRTPRPARTVKRSRRARGKKTPAVAGERLELLVRAANDVFWDWNLITDEIWWSESVTKVLGYARSDVVADSTWWEKCVHPEDRTRVRAGVTAAFRDGKQSWSDEYRFRRADGSYAVIFDRGYVLRNGKGKPLRMIGAMLDVSDRKRSEERLRLSEERLALAVAGAGLGTWHVNVVTRELAWSDKCREIFGISPGQTLTYDSFLTRIHPDDRARVHQAVGDALKLGKDYEAEFRVVRGDGAVRWIAATGRCYYDRDGNPAHMEGVVVDTTENKRREEQARSNLERMRALHEIETAITSTLDLGRVLDILLEKILCSTSYAATTVRLLNRTTGELEPVASKNLDEEKWKRTFSSTPGGLSQVVLERKKTLTVEDITADPRTRHRDFFRDHGLISLLGIPLIAKDESLGVLAVFTRNRHRFEDEEIEFLTTLAGQAAMAIHNAQLYEEMVRANKVREEFLSVMSHELRTPLSVVMGYAGMLKEGLLGETSPQQNEALTKILSRAADQLHMINSIIQTTQLETHAVGPEYHAINLPEFLTHLRSEMDTTREKTNVAVQWDYPLQPVYIVTDGGKLRQILENLIGNALKFTDHGIVTVSARLLQSGNGSGHPSRFAHSRCVEFKVTDTGVGIPDEQFHSIFDKFYQVDSSETRLYGGIGLGLYIVKHFTELLGGEIRVDSERGKGSTFTLTLPYAS